MFLNDFSFRRVCHLCWESVKGVKRACVRLECALITGRLYQSCYVSYGYMYSWFDCVRPKTATQK